MSGGRHPLPDSDEARHDEIPEDLAEEKGRGDDSKPVGPAGPRRGRPRRRALPLRR